MPTEAQQTAHICARTCTRTHTQGCTPAALLTCPPCSHSLPPTSSLLQLAISPSADSHQKNRVGTMRTRKAKESKCKPQWASLQTHEGHTVHPAPPHALLTHTARTGDTLVPTLWWLPPGGALSPFLSTLSETHINSPPGQSAGLGVLCRNPVHPAPVPNPCDSPTHFHASRPAPSADSGVPRLGKAMQSP